MLFTAIDVVKRFELLPHPEGGFYKETYRSGETIGKDGLPDRFTGERSFSTSIYFLLEQGNFSAFHRIKSDECWHFYGGQTLHVHVIHPEGKYELIRLGNDLAGGTTFQAVVPACCWFASETAEGGDFSFVGCTVAPGFDFADFELADRRELSTEFPQFEKLINRLCR